jgi:hypothetical protein
MQRREPGRADRRWYWLLLTPVVAMLWVPSYNAMEPRIAGVPFFYWYQFVWIALTSLVTLAVYLLAHNGGRD